MCFYFTICSYPSTSPPSSSTPSTLQRFQTFFSDSFRSSTSTLTNLTHCRICGHEFTNKEKICDCLKSDEHPSHEETEKKIKEQYQEQKELVHQVVNIDKNPEKLVHFINDIYELVERSSLHEDLSPKRMEKVKENLVNEICVHLEDFIKDDIHKVKMGATTSKGAQNQSQNQSGRSKSSINEIPVNKMSEDDELFEKITSISKELYRKYQKEFLNPNFCKKLSTIYKKKLFELDIQTLQNIHNQINTQSNSPAIQAVLSYTPSESEKFLVEEFKTGLHDYLWNHEVQMNPAFFEEKNIPMTIIDSENKVRYINTAHIAKIFQQVQKEVKQEKKEQHGGARSSSSLPNLSSSSSSLFTNNSSSTSASGSETNEYGFSGNQNINGSKSGSRKMNQNGNQNQNKVENKRNGNMKMKKTNFNIQQNLGNLNELKKKIQQANRNFGFHKEEAKEAKSEPEKLNQSHSFNNEELQQFLAQIPGKPLNANMNLHKRANTNTNTNTNTPANTNMKAKAKANTGTNTPNTQPLTFNLHNYQKPTLFCSSNQERCMMTKSELCKGITEHFIVRGNIIASILSNIPYKTNRGFEGGYCYQRFLNLDKCQVCLPHNYQELMSMDPKTRIQTMMVFINYMTEKECVEKNGLFRKLSIGEKKSLLQHARNGDEFNILYTEYTQNVRQKYIEHLQILLEILNALSSLENINNEELNALSLKTKETIDSMVHLCQFYYIYAVIALLNANLQPVNSEERSQKNQLRNRMQQYLTQA